MDLLMDMATSDLCPHSTHASAEDAHIHNGCNRTSSSSTSTSSSSNGQAAAAVDSSSMSCQSDGWPLGLIMRLPARAILIESIHCSSFLSSSSSASSSHALAGDANDSSSLAKCGSMSIAVPSSITSASWSSSDLDTESTWSFFPERSTTLGRLMGIHSLSQLEPKRVSTILEAKRIRTDYSTPRTSAPRVAIIARTRSWCFMFLRCRGDLHSQAIGMSPSLAHFLDMERKKKCSKRPSTTRKEKQRDEHIVHNVGVVSTTESVARGTHSLSMKGFYCLHPHLDFP